MRANRCRCVAVAGPALAACASAFAVPAQATDFLEFRGTVAGHGGRDRAALDLGLGAAGDVYVVSRFGARLGADLLLTSYFTDPSSVPGTLAIAPDLAGSYGRDGATRRWFLVFRPITLRIVNLRSGGSDALPLRSELGVEYEARAENGGLRLRAGVFYAPGASFTEAKYEWAAASLRLTVAWAKPPPPLPDPGKLPGE
jgi:hypothetical protein